MFQVKRRFDVRSVEFNVPGPQQKLSINTDITTNLPRRSLTILNCRIRILLGHLSTMRGLPEYDPPYSDLGAMSTYRLPIAPVAGGMGDGYGIRGFPHIMRNCSRHSRQGL